MKHWIRFWGSYSALFHVQMIVQQASAMWIWSKAKTRGNKPTFCSLLHFDLSTDLWRHLNPPQIQGSQCFEVINPQRACIIPPSIPGSQKKKQKRWATSLWICFSGSSESFPGKLWHSNCQYVGWGANKETFGLCACGSRWDSTASSQTPEVQGKPLGNSSKQNYMFHLFVFQAST